MKPSKTTNNSFLTQPESKMEPKVQSLDFSKSTYSVHVVEGDSSFWPLVELDEAGRLKEALCACEDSVCQHVRCALAAIIQDGVAVHQKFERHFWHQLFYRLSTIWDWSAEDFVYSEKNLRISNEEESIEISWKNQSAGEAIRKILHERPECNERNSIKFSNLPLQELKAWSRGKPGPWLRYELSAWSDLAKLFFFQSQGSDGICLSFAYNGSRLCCNIQMQLYAIKLDLQIFEWEFLLDYLASLKPSLVHSTYWQDYLVAIEPDANRFKLRYSLQAPGHLERTSRQRLDPLPQWRIKDWAYWPEHGLWKISGSDTWPQSLSARELASLLDDKQNFPGVWGSLKINFEPIELGHHIFFDNKGYLHVQPYLWSQGDLQKGKILLFERWAFDNQKGFQRILEDEWDHEITVKPNAVEAFVDKNIDRLRIKAPFEIHTMGLELQLGWRVQEGKSLEFVDELQQEPGLVAYGHWIYTPSHGLFWQKNNYQSLHPGQKVRWNDLESFLDRHRSDLEDVPHFWASDSPLQGQYLKVDWCEKGLTLMPYEVLKEPSLRGKIYWAGNYSFVPSDGFYHHTEPPLLPREFRKEQFIKPGDMDEFLEQVWPDLRAYVEKIPVELSEPQSMRLVIEKAYARKFPGGPLRLEAKLKSKLGEVSLTELLAGKAKRWYLTPAGLIDRQSPFGRWLMRLEADELPGTVQIPPLALLRIREIMAVDSFDDDIKAFLGSWLEASGKLPNIGLLQAQLRPYQEIGVRWMWQLMDNGLGALLCDDMGLGKTHQVMGVMAALFAANSQARVLIACPTSVLYHWLDKLSNFLPSISVQVYHGPKRKLDIANQVVVTSYGVLRQDSDLIGVVWNLAVFDEVQLAKNARSRIWKACGSIQSNHKIGLSGTPVENSLKDLKALFDLIYPGYLPDDALFKSEYVHAIEKYRDSQALERLRHCIEPLVLRRSKREVLTQLPEKMEEVGWCEMSLEQRQLYQSVLNRSREELIEQLEDLSQPIPYMHIFAVINSLKQICDHPACYWRNREVPAKLSEHQSGKWNLFTTLLQEALSSQQKVVVFSQYLAMLDLIEEYLHAHRIHYSGLRGSTKARGSAVRRFQEDEDCRVFVSSLSAGGLGIELTAGSVVILYDRWWNAARENQAIDRVHRLGQTRGVQVFRLVTRASLEERIAEIIERKARLMEEVTPVDDPSVLKRFTRDELKQILSYNPDEASDISDTSDIFD